MPEKQGNPTFTVFKSHLKDGWWMVGSYLKKWLLYNVYALAIYVVLVAWLLGVYLVAGLFEFILPGLGWVVGAIVFILSPAVFSIAQSSRVREAGGTVTD